ncbi:MAG: Uma2 family endonuclease [Planctomycetota bacterium]|nr:Uma2 family endonuclease [Planctomycetota bacterium]
MPVRTLLTCEDFEKLAPQLGVCELVDGEVTELSPAGMPQGHVTMCIASLLFDFVGRRHLGWVMGNETGIHVSRKKQRSRGADVLFISYKRLPEGKLKKGFLTVPPELIVEVLGEEDTWPRVQEKVRDYHEFGVDMVWVADPDNATVKILPRGGTPQTVGPEGEIDGGEILPGFRVPVAKLFGRQLA